MILVTGGTGLVGSHLLFELAKNKQQVRAIYRSEEKLEAVKKVFSYFTEDAETLFHRISWVQTDLLNIPELTSVFEGVTHVYHCAALISFDPSDYHILRKTNIEGTANIVNLSIDNEVEKLCYVSSVATIGHKKDGSLLDEESYWNPEADNSVYSITKYGAEMEVWRGTQEGLDAVIVNPGLILGAGFWNTGSGQLFKRVAGTLPYYTTGTAGYVDVKDVVVAMLQLMESNIKNERFILIAENLSFKDFVTMASKQLKVKIPTKPVKPWMLQIAWRLDWLKSFLTKKPRSLTKQNAASALSATNYNNEKVVKALDYTFIPIEESIASISEQYLKEL
ncbi:nucleoside-diphosphate-sugar epimerase [Oceanihabitans sediminis]|uniref:NAD-dependent epimerase/dehydratase family protein n=1 Tax=Oceanihabitans sediminis TaxID=1812012 RepID=A0A368P802_9FLAO|nr:NAD-dependent epimerase/dehydratase family protein [Oceanihabitans sediminis]RBP34959.1 nucleoside-diphosphate-sugar epimerase [Oceanihabitans sediminis]RCU58596.1 NAD-dependent epimerase/dehydratase family protein [Oceanihabitans sediminis]